ncbi:exocyst complex component EXO70A1-like [Impatiens glandulifera]|uniref:exocyst complex component EXO70A1-like n=1 Tax=Impatiens glandulifera TaxID=253017 RepID=UPI001FB1510E|nr:exocyst complex component EXO70A1-like [Impatiens glandulifera]
MSYICGTFNEKRVLLLKRTHAIRRAHENIDKTLKASEVILSQFDISRQVESKILRSPHEDLESYLEAIQQLKSNISFFSNNKSFKSSDGVINHSNNLLAKALSKLEQEFEQIMSSYSKPVEPERLFECLPSSLRPSSKSTDNEGNSGGKHHFGHEQHHNAELEDAVYTTPLLQKMNHPNIVNLTQFIIENDVLGYLNLELNYVRRKQAETLKSFPTFVVQKLKILPAFVVQQEVEVEKQDEDIMDALIEVETTI